MNETPVCVCVTQHCMCYIYIYIYMYIDRYIYGKYEKFVYMAHHFILLWLNPFDFGVDREGWWFKHSVSQLRVCLLLSRGC